jgi:hypothetical protein
LVRPTFGSARHNSYTFADSSHSGGSSKNGVNVRRRAFKSRFNSARRDRIVFAFCSASNRCCNDRSGAVIVTDISFAS